VTGDDVPIGRRVASWRVRRQMTQQVLADRLRRSKSWVDKIERGVRPLDRYSVIQEVAHVLRVEPEVLLGQPRGTPAGTPDGVDGIRAALARYDVPQAPPQTDELRRQVGHAWLTYQHAHYGQLVRLLPGLLDAAQGARSAELLVQAYRITSMILDAPVTDIKYRRQIRDVHTIQERIDRGRVAQQYLDEQWARLALGAATLPFNWSVASEALSSDIAGADRAARRRDDPRWEPL
jgi:transcriptional regulator with XRE-family HTH domain